MNFRISITLNAKNNVQQPSPNSNVIQNLRDGSINWTNPLVDLPTLVAHIKSFSDILVLANNGVDWKKDAYHKAMQWALYFEQVIN